MKNSDQLELLLELPLPASRSLSYQQAVERNMPTHRFASGTKPVLQSKESSTSQTQQTEQSVSARPGTMISGKV